MTEHTQMTCFYPYKSDFYLFLVWNAFNLLYLSDPNHIRKIVNISK